MQNSEEMTIGKIHPTLVGQRVGLKVYNYIKALLRRLQNVRASPMIALSRQQVTAPPRARPKSMRPKVRFPFNPQMVKN